ncbi:uncharacterized protein P7C70_g2096, partial [Phenoliferia sp. Uapishka_3]
MPPKPTEDVKNAHSDPAAPGRKHGSGRLAHIGSKLQATFRRSHSSASLAAPAAVSPLLSPTPASTPEASETSLAITGPPTSSLQSRGANSPLSALTTSLAPSPPAVSTPAVLNPTPVPTSSSSTNADTSKNKLITQAELKAKFKYLQGELEVDKLSPARERLRIVAEWASGFAGITLEVLQAVPMTSPYSPIFSAVLFVAFLPRGGREVVSACNKLMERMLGIFEDSYRLRETKEARIDGELDKSVAYPFCAPVIAPTYRFISSRIFNAFYSIVSQDVRKTTSDWIIGLSKEKTLALVADLDKWLNTLQFDFIVPALRDQGMVLLRIDENVKNLATPALITKYEICPATLVSLLTKSFCSTPLIPPPQQDPLIGREEDVKLVVERLIKLQHVAIVGVGGLGKTSLARAVIADPRANVIGTPVFIACERLLQLRDFQLELLRLRAPKGLQVGETLEDAVQLELFSEKRLLVLDNLLDNPSEAPADYLQFISTLADIPSVTLLITTRNHQLGKSFGPSRRIHAPQLGGLSDDASEEFFRAEFNGEDHSRELTTPEPFLSDLLSLLSGVPLAIKLVAAVARSETSLQDVIDMWKDGTAWDNVGIEDRKHSLDVSLSLSFRHLSADTISLLRLLAELPHPISRQRRFASPAIRTAIDTALRCSIAQVEVVKVRDFDAGLDKEHQVVKLLEPVRQYLRRLQNEVDVNSAIVRQLACNYFSGDRVPSAWRIRGSDEGWNFLSVLECMRGAVSKDFEEQRLAAVFRFIEKGLIRWEERCDLLSKLVSAKFQDLIRVYTLEDAGTAELSVLMNALEQAKEQNLVRTQAVISQLITLKGNGEDFVPFKVRLDLFASASLLHQACHEGLTETVRVLLEGGLSPSDLNIRNQYGWTSLHFASIFGRPEISRLLLKAGASLDARDSWGNTTLHLAADEDNLENIKLLLEAGASVDAKNDKGDTPLHQAAGCDGGDSEVAKLLIGAGASVDAKDANGEAPLHLAAREGHLEIARLLLEAGASVDAEDDKGQTPLHQAAMEEVAKLLVSAGASLEYKDDEGGATPLHYAAAAGKNVTYTSGDFLVMMVLLDATVSIDVKDNDGNTPLHNAAYHGHLWAAALLLESRANIDTENDGGQTPLQVALEEDNEEVATFLAKWERDDTGLHLAALKGVFEITILLCEAGASDDIDDFEGGSWSTPLHWTTRKGELEIAKLLIGAGCSLEAKDKNGNTPLHLAASGGHLEVTRLLLEAGASVDAKNNWGQTPLHQAAGCDGGHSEVAKLLIGAGVLPEAKNKDGNTPLHLTACGDHLEITRLLPEAGPSVDAQNNQGETSLHKAAFKGNLDIAKVLLRAGASLEARDLEGRTPLHMAASYGQLEVLRLLFGAGATVEAEDFLNGATPLHYAALFDHREILRFLLGAGATVNAKDTHNGETPLHYAACRGHTEAARLLLEFGADVTAKSDEGKTPLQEAMREGKHEFVTFLAEVIKAKATPIDGANAVV